MSTPESKFEYAEELIAQSIRTQSSRLSLSGLGLVSLPDSISAATHVKQLLLCGNNLTVFPSKILEIGGLENLHLHDNDLSELPDEISCFSQLKFLHVSNNRISRLPTTIGELKRLNRLLVNFNGLTEIPDCLQGHTTLQYIGLQGNPQLRLPDSILQDDSITASAVLEYYFRSKDAGTPLHEVKMVLVGRGMAGKTSIVRRLVDNRFDADEPETPGIAIRPWKIDVNGENIDVHTWDFAGQIVTHSTHHFFLTERTLYVLVLTGRENSERDDAEYWLRLIRAFGTDKTTSQTSPVIVVLNKCLDHPCRLDRNALKDKYPFIANFVETDCKGHAANEGEGFDELRSNMRSAISKMPDIHNPFPDVWRTVKEKLCGIAKDYLPYSEYKKICTELGEEDAGSQKNLAKILHSLGVALNFGDDQRLCDATILNPHWVTNGIYKLLREGVDDKTGELTVESAGKVLPDESPEMRQYLIDLMRRFELAFPMAENDELWDGCKWLVPQRLPDNQPQLSNEWTEDVLRLRFQYAALPEGVIPRFITRTWPLSQGQARWMNGVILDDDGSGRALVRADPVERQVSIVVRGTTDDKRRLAGSILTDFERIHGDISGIDPICEIEVSEKPGLYARLDTLKIDEKKSNKSAAGDEKGTHEFSSSGELDKVFSAKARNSKQWKPKLFISYSSKDPQQFDQLSTRIKPLISEGLLETWSDRCLIAGQEWDKKIRKELEEADIILFLVSATFEATDYIQDVEVKRAIERATAGDARVVSVLLEKTTLWQRTALADYTALPDKAKPVRDHKPQRDGWHFVAQKLWDLCEEVQASRIAAPVVEMEDDCSLTEKAYADSPTE